MEPATEEKTEQRQETEPGRHKTNRPGRGRALIAAALAAVLVLTAALAVFMTRNRENSSVIAGMDYYEPAVDDKIYSS